MIPYICLTHYSDDLIEEFSPTKTVLQREIVFYWYHDQFFNWMDHKYIHLIIVEPKNYLLRSRMGNRDFHGIHLDYKRMCRFLLGKTRYKYFEPSNVVSPYNIKPTLIGKIDHKSKTKEVTIVYPENGRGIKFSLLGENGNPIRFDEIPELVNICPEIKQSAPIYQIKKINGKYHLEGFREFVTEKDGWWI